MAGKMWAGRSLYILPVICIAAGYVFFSLLGFI